MNREAATKILPIAREGSRRVDESIKRVMDSSHSTVFLAYRRLAGRIMGNIFTEILAPIWSEHPDLAPEWFTMKSGAQENRIFRSIQEDLLSLMDELSQSLEATVVAAQSGCSEEAAARYRQNVDEIMANIVEMKTYLASLDPIENAPHDDTKAGSSSPSSNGGS